MIIAALILGFGVITELFAVAKAPVGYQDETGFHIGASRAEDDDGRCLNPS